MQNNYLIACINRKLIKFNQQQFVFKNFYSSRKSQMLKRLNLNIMKQFSSTYQQKMYEVWINNPSEVHSEWNDYFTKNKEKIEYQNFNNKQQILNLQKNSHQHLIVKAYHLINIYKHKGHQKSQIDPLNLQQFSQFGKKQPKQCLYKLLEQIKLIQQNQLDVKFNFPNNKWVQENIAYFLKEKQYWTLRELRNKLEEIYSNRYGIQYMHLQNKEEKAWLMKQAEQLCTKQFTNAQKINLLDEMIRIQALNNFLCQKVKTIKRFGVEGLDSFISGINHLVQVAAEKGVEFIGVGTPHRGRVNLMANVFKKSMQRIFSEYQEKVVGDEEWGLSGDVNYHLGVSNVRNIKDKKIKLSILPNPSHLETVDPLVMGHVKAYADQTQNKDKSLCIMVHGDGAIAGQGVVYECLQMSQLPHYKTNGIIHVVCNNQVAFTTTAQQGRSTLYCTDVAKSVQAPVIHVNSQQPELVSKCFQLAFKYRQKFHKDIFIQIVGFRRYGHNEMDQPLFTQPIMYNKIAAKDHTFGQYSNKLIKQGVVDSQHVNNLWNQQLQRLKKDWEVVNNQNFDIKNVPYENYHRFKPNAQYSNRAANISRQALQKIGESVYKVAQNFKIDSEVRKIYDARRQALIKGQSIDFGTAETLSFGSLLKSGYGVRLGGQDVQNSKYISRYSILQELQTKQKYIPLHNILTPSTAHKFQIQNSTSNQYGSLGFQYGYSFTNLNNLTIWEPPTGNFANAGQIVIDDYLTSGESKFNIKSGLVLNMIHGIDGKSAQVNSARVQRFLQLANQTWANIKKQDVLADNYDPYRKINLQVFCPSTSANLYHLYRRQMLRDFRKPLANILDKNVVRSYQASSSLTELIEGKLLTVIDDLQFSANNKDIKKVVLTSGNAYYSALKKRNQLGRKDTVLIRIQQFAPFDYAAFKKIVEKYSNATEFIWFQQQNRNSGAWGYLAPRISKVLSWAKQEQKIKTSSLDVCCRNILEPDYNERRIKQRIEGEKLLTQLFK